MRDGLRDPGGIEQVETIAEGPVSEIERGCGGFMAAGGARKGVARVRLANGGLFCRGTGTRPTRLGAEFKIKRRL
jgi:hypothetical protein